MPADIEKIESILRSKDFPITEIRTLIDQRPDLSISSRKKEELIEALLNVTWSDNQFDNLKERFAEIRRERTPMGHYVMEINEIDLMTEQPKYEEIRNKLLRNEAEISDNGIDEAGFRVEEANQEIVSGIYWTKTRTFRLDALRRLQSAEREYDFGFEIDLENNRLYMSGDNYGKVGELRSEFESIGFELEPVTLDDIDDPNEANQTVREFVSELRSRLDEIKEQRDMSDYSDQDGPTLLYIDEVQIKLLSGELRRANLEGSEDIFDNDQVTNLTEDEGGRISRIKGRLEYDGKDFDFNIGYTDDYGRVSVEKKGRLAGVDVVEEAFEFLSELYEEYYV